MLLKVWYRWLSSLLIRLLHSRVLAVEAGCELRFAPSAQVVSIGAGRLLLERGSRLVLHEGARLELRGSFSVGRDCTLVVHPHGSLKLGAQSWCLHGCWIEVAAGETIEIGDAVSVQLRCSLHGSVTIGDHTLVAPEVYISSGTHVFDAWPGLPIREQDQRAAISRPVSVGRQCWLGLRTWVAPGLTLADGTVTGANSVITSSTQAWSVYAGVPARRLRTYRSAEALAPESIDPR
jgi:acetyltransferase-like isoleucine patch superfamily enzyme